jgi:sterol desaturase/sphingolipid hydroxylase (fatty acid hydroxylase superfamily)
VPARTDASTAGETVGVWARIASPLHHALTLGLAVALFAWALPRDPVATLVALPFGWLWGSLFEYLIHRFVMHGRTPAARAHARHHAQPDAEQLDLRSWASPFGFWAAAWLIVVAASGHVPAACAVVAGGCVQYSWFRGVHRAMHAAWRPRALDALAAFHEAHHAYPRANFGVSARGWDRWFGTWAPIAVVSATGGDVYAASAGGRRRDPGNARDAGDTGGANDAQGALDTDARRRSGA